MKVTGINASCYRFLLKEQRNREENIGPECYRVVCTYIYIPTPRGVQYKNEEERDERKRSVR